MSGSLQSLKGCFLKNTHSPVVHAALQVTLWCCKFDYYQRLVSRCANLKMTFHRLKIKSCLCLPPPYPLLFLLLFFLLFRVYIGKRLTTPPTSSFWTYTQKKSAWEVGQSLFVCFFRPIVLKKTLPASFRLSLCPACLPITFPEIWLALRRNTSVLLLFLLSCLLLSLSLSQLICTSFWRTSQVTVCISWTVQCFLGDGFYRKCISVKTRF